MSKKTIEKGTMFNQMVELSFKEADLDNSGVIEKNELIHIIHKLHLKLGINEPPDEAEVQKFLEQYDTNSDGVISKEEYVKLVKDLIEFEGF